MLGGLVHSGWLCCNFTESWFVSQFAAISLPPVSLFPEEMDPILIPLLSVCPEEGAERLREGAKASLSCEHGKRYTNVIQSRTKIK